MNMAVKQKNHLSLKIDDNLQSDLDAYVESKYIDKAKVVKQALREFLDRNLRPTKKKLTA